MSAINPEGNENYWFEGEPFRGLKNGSLDEGTESYWFKALSGLFLFPTIVLGFLSADKTMPSGYHCFMSQFFKNRQANFIPLKTPDEANRCW